MQSEERAKGFDQDSNSKQKDNNERETLPHEWDVLAVKADSESM
jgi:hypothetical protein